MNQLPFAFNINTPSFIPSVYNNHVTRHLSAMNGQYLDQAAYETALAVADPLLYEVYELRRPENSGEIFHGISIIHPGKVGDEYYMTKGHFHTVLETAEIYYCLQGHGYIVMENPEGEWSIEEMVPGQVCYIAPRWAHRSVNASLTEDFTFFYTCPAHAGHNYGTIEEQGFRKLIVERDGQPQVVDNPRWRVKDADSGSHMR